MRRLAVVVGVALAVLLPSAAAADDEVEIDQRLGAEGYAGAYSDYLVVTTGQDEEAVVVSLDYASGSVDAEEYDAEARRAAELVWQHLEMRVHAVVVAPAAGVVWTDGAVPPAVALSRSQLEQAFGPRPASLDGNGAGFYGSEGTVFVVIGIAVMGLLGIGLLIGAFFWGRWTGRRAERRAMSVPAWGASPAAAGWGTGAPPGWGTGAPPGWGAGAPPPGPPAAGPSSSDPWRPM